MIKKSDTLLFLDFELNKPLTYLNKFKQLLQNKGWIVDLFWARDYEKKQKPSFDEKINDKDFLIIRKPLTFLTSTQARQKIQDAVLKDKKNLLIMYTYYDIESFEVLSHFLQPFKITPSDIKIIDNKTNLKNKNVVVFHKKNDCFRHEQLFSGVSKLIISDPRHLMIEPPAKIMIRGNPSSESLNIYNEEISEVSGSDLVAGAYYEDSGKIVLVNSTVFLDQYFDHNKIFIDNVINWLSETTKQKGKSKTKAKAKSKPKTKGKAKPKK